MDDVRILTLLNGSPTHKHNQYQVVSFVVALDEEGQRQRLIRWRMEERKEGRRRKDRIENIKKNASRGIRVGFIYE